MSTAYLLILINTADQKVVDAMIASQDGHAMCVVPKGHVWAELYRVEAPFTRQNNYEAACVSLLRTLEFDRDHGKAFSWVIPMLRLRWEAQGNALSHFVAEAPNEIISDRVRLERSLFGEEKKQ